MRDYDFQNSGQLKSASEAHALGLPVLGAASIGMAGGTPAQPPSPPLVISMGELAQNVELLNDTVRTLESKLAPVMYSEPPSPARADQAVQTRSPRASCELGTAINNIADQIEYIYDRVRAIVRRCEL